MDTVNNILEAAGQARNNGIDAFQRIFQDPNLLPRMPDIFRPSVKAVKVLVYKLAHLKT